ncbi:MAG: LuxR C-terminal-related transcriptional regulator [Pseudomonas sp.]|uniref:LuxR C-terminal-related transcriptional regulator n=1 Tax=Pseudomonas sp. TaxID=306 RepID=UPI000AA6B3AF
MGAVEQPAADSLWRSRLTPPQIPADALTQPQVLDVFASQPNARVLLFCAPAGFGKTTALALLARQRQSQGSLVAWFSLASEDDDPSRFYSQLIEALSSALPGVGQDALGYLQNTMRVPVAAVMESLLVDLAQATQPLLLVLDDLHLLRDPELYSALNRLVRLAPNGFTLALGSRSQPPLSLATWRAKGLLLEIGPNELRLSLDQTGDYLGRLGLQINAQALAELHRHTEGWMVGVHLASLWLRNQPPAGAQMPDIGADQVAVGEYLLCSVFERLPLNLQEALLALSVARQLSGDLASALTGRQDGQQLLESLEVMQLFLLPLDRERQWYRFHNVFAEFLQARLKGRDPERFKQLHFNASLWFTNHHMQDLAIEHAGLAEDPEMLAALVDACGLEMINRGQLNQIYRWRKQVPDAIAERFPILVLAEVWDKAAELALPQANGMLDALLARFESGKTDTQVTDNYLAVLAVKAVLALQKDDLQACVNLARKIEPQLGQHSAFLEVAILLVGALAHVVLIQPEHARRLLALAQQRNHFLEGRYLDMQLVNVEIFMALEQGQVKQAQLLFAQLRTRVLPWFGEKSRALALPAICEALIAYQQGQLEGLEDKLKWALATVDVINPIDLYAQAMLCLARTQRMQDKPKEAMANLALMQNLAARNQSWRFYAQAVGDEIALILQEPATDRIKRAEQRLQSFEWAKRAEQYQPAGFNPVLWVLSISRIRLQQARGNYSEALHEITQARALLQPNWHGLQRLRLDLLAALSYQRLGYQERGQSLLQQCLLSAEREGLRSLFIEEGEAIRQLLVQLESAERQPALQGFIRSVLALWPGQSLRKSAEVLEEALTEREREVVCLAAKGLSNDEIGQQLSLALGTVKWHLHNIYEKLKVRNRTQAIRRVRELSLLES